MKESMGRKGYIQGDMSPKVEEYQKPMNNFSQEGFSKTTEYIERHNSFEGREAGDIRKQGYKGRYS
jgi:hypothetical protein